VFIVGAVLAGVAIGAWFFARIRRTRGRGGRRY
jgi:hypothetical protein